MNDRYSNGTEEQRKSSLEALSRTIDGLESRIERLMAHPAPRSFDRRSAEPEVEDEIETAHRRATRQIVERQRILEQERANLEARLAARRTGLRSETASPASEKALREIAETLVGLRGELKDDFSASLKQEISSLRSEIATMASTGGHPLPPSMRDDLLRLSECIEQLGKSSGHGDDGEMLDEISGLREAIEAFAGAAERNWSMMDERLREIDPQTLRSEVVGLAHRLEDIKDAVEALPASVNADEIDGQLKQVASALEMLAEQANLDEAALDHRFTEMAERLDEISRAVVSVAAKADRTEDGETLARIESRMEGISHQLAALDDHDPIAELTDRVTALAGRVGMLASEETVTGLGDRLDQLSQMLETSRDQDGSELADRLVEISRKIDMLDRTAVDDALVERLDRLASRIDDIAGGVAVANEEVFDRLEALVERVESKSAAPVRIAGIDRLDEQLADIARRLDENGQANPDLADLRGLETQIARLSEVMSRPMADAEGREAIFEPRLAAIEEHLATNDEYVVEAARQAAEAVVEAYSRGGSTGTTGMQASELAVISELADDLRSLESLTHRSDERTARAFDAVHDTLVKIAQHLERLGTVREETGGTKNATETANTRRERVAAPVAVMPRASVAAFGDDEPGEIAHAAIDEDERYVETPAARLREAGGTDTREDADDAFPVAAPEAGFEEEPTAAKPGFLKGLGKRLRPRRAEVAAAQADVPERVHEERADLGETPSIDPSESLDPVSINQPIEPGAGGPDINQIMAKVREVQNTSGGGTGQNRADFIAAARRAAQAAAAEVETTRNVDRDDEAGLAAALKRHRKPILLAVGAVLLVVMAYPLTAAFLKGPERPVVAQAPARHSTKNDVVASSAPNVSSETTAATGGKRHVAAGSAHGTGKPAAAPTTTASNMAAKRSPAGKAVPATGGKDASVGKDGPVKVADFKAHADPIAATPPRIAASGSAAPATKTADARPAEKTGGTETASAAKMQAAPATVAGSQAETAAPIVALAPPPAVPDAIQPVSLRHAAEKGQANALFEIGSRYTEGRGVKLDMAEAARWYKAAAERGLAPAEYRLANFYENGSGVDRDLDKARGLYLKAAEQGNASAMHNLAVLYAMGKDGKPDYTEAADWFRKAADHGIKDSQFNLAVLYAQGRGVPRDMTESYKWFAIAAVGGDDDATSKRDQVAAALTPKQLLEARATVSEWKPEKLDPAANAVAIPPEWRTDDTRTASVDMSKAIRNIQAILDNAGFDAGKPDGVMGEKTRSAIMAFQKSKGEKPTGEITDALIKQLLDLNKDQQNS